MRQLLVLLLSLGCLSGLAQSPSEDSGEAITNKQIALAELNLQRVKGLVEAGVLPRIRLQQAQEDLADVQDQAVLDRTLFSPLSAKDWNDNQAGEMLAAAERRIDREQERIDNARKLVAAGIAGASSITPFEIELATRQTMLDLARSRANLLSEAAALSKFEQTAGETSSTLADEDNVALTVTGMEHYDGGAMFDESRDLPALESAFESKFAHPLPISADGETDLHRALGFDHRGRVDVALSPSDTEGIWLRQYLKSRKIPYYAFTRAFPGRATAAHVHIGPGSTRLHATD